MQKFSPVRHFCLILLSVIMLSGCSIGWMQQKFHYLSKVAANVSAERDTVLKHAQQIIPQVEKAAETVTASGSSTDIELQKTGSMKKPLQFARTETDRIVRSHPELRPLMKSHSSLAEAQNPGALLIVLLILLLVLFLALAVTASANSDGACLGCFFWVLVICIACTLIGLLL